MKNKDKYIDNKSGERLTRIPKTKDKHQLISTFEKFLK